MGNQRRGLISGLRPVCFFLGKQPCRGPGRGALLFPRKKANWLQSRDQSSSSWLPRTVLRAAMGKNLTSISGTSGPPHPLQSTIQPILGVLEQFWPKNLAEQAYPTASPMTAAGSEDIHAPRNRRDITRRRMPRDLGAQLYSPFNQPARSRASREVRRREQQFCHGQAA